MNECKHDLVISYIQNNGMGLYFVKYRPVLAILLEEMLSGRTFESKVTGIIVLLLEKQKKSCPVTPARPLWYQTTYY